MNNSEYNEPDEQTKLRWFYWNKLVTEGKKHSYPGVPLPFVKTVEIDGEEVKVVDYSEQDGVLNKIGRRRAKNRVAKQSRKANRGK